MAGILSSWSWLITWCHLVLIRRWKPGKWKSKFSKNSYEGSVILLVSPHTHQYKWSLLSYKAWKTLKIAYYTGIYIIITQQRIVNSGNKMFLLVHCRCVKQVWRFHYRAMATYQSTVRLIVSIIWYTEETLCQYYLNDQIYSHQWPILSITVDFEFQRINTVVVSSFAMYLFQLGLHDWVTCLCFVN